MTTGHQGSMPREHLSELLSGASPAAVVELANRCLAGADAESFRVLRPADVGSVVVQVREPIARQRFILADAVVTSAEISLHGTTGWAMRMGEDREATLAQAVCDAELVRSGPLAGQILDLCGRLEAERAEARAEEWDRLQPTIVEFEEIP